MSKNIIILSLLCVGAVVAYLLFAGDSSQKIQKASNSGPIVCFGDSLTYGTGARENEDYPSHLSRLIGEEIINAGIPGNTTEQALARLDDDVLSYAPRMVIITLGGNDLKNGVSAAEAFANLTTIITTIQKSGALAVVLGIEIPLLDRGYSQGYQTLGQDFPIVLLPNLYEGIMGKGQYMSDQIHPNGQGYKRIAQKVYAEIQEYL